MRRRDFYGLLGGGLCLSSALLAAEPKPHSPSRRSPVVFEQRIETIAPGEVLAEPAAATIPERPATQPQPLSEPQRLFGIAFPQARTFFRRPAGETILAAGEQQRDLSPTPAGTSSGNTLYLPEPEPLPDSRKPSMLPAEPLPVYGAPCDAPVDCVATECAPAAHVVSPRSERVAHKVRAPWLSRWWPQSSP
ncbi:hypothetical protein [Planctomicrobium sp. SH664]|uniref:hypothetical protein n=1 Tax=Planctomicrobium sp. SH664 TaxID=3448125 RepID=UPI003F5CB5C2